MHYQHLSIEERETIQRLLWEGKRPGYIAMVLGRSRSSITRELKKNKTSERAIYTPRLAQAKAAANTAKRGRTQRLKNDTIRNYVVTHLHQGWSPEQIAGRMKLDGIGTISHEAIYQYVYAQIHRNGWGLPKPGKEDLRIYLRRKQKRRQKKGLRKAYKLPKFEGVSIDTRPPIVTHRRRVGDFEGDTVESVDHKPGVNTLLERKTGMFFITKVADKTASATTIAVTRRLAAIPQRLRHTLTLDNGSENADWQTVEHTTQIRTYFAHPYHSWERGANENANGLLREYFPKGTDFTMISDEQIAVVEQRLNTRPRKRLGYQTPLEVWNVALRG